MAIQFSNLASTTLASGVSSSATSVSVTSASLFPTLGGGDYFYATLGAGTGSEIVKVTAISGTTFTVIRGQDGTTAVSHSAGVDCALRVTAASLEDLRDATDNDTTYSVQDGELSENNFTNADHSKLDGIATSANNYSHPSAHAISFITGLQTALDGKVDDSQVLTNVPSGAVFTDTNTVYTHPSNHAISVITGLQTALDGKVDDSQVLTNVPSGALFTDTNTTYSVGDNGLTQRNFTNTFKSKLEGIATSANNYVLPSGIATETYVGTQISNLVDSSPATLNTLNELAAALGDDPNFATTVSTSIGTKLPLAGGSMSGTLTMGSNAITGTGTINSGAITSSSSISARNDYVIATQGNAQLVLLDNTTPALNLNIGVDTAIGANGGASIQVTQSSVSNDRDLKLNPYGGKVGVGVSSATALTSTFTVNGTIDSGAITSSGNISLGGTDGNNAVLSLTANTGNWVFTNVQASRNLEISDSDGTGVALTIDTSANATFAGTINSGAITSGNIGISGDSIGRSITDTFTLNGRTQPQYGFNLAPVSNSPIGMSGYYGIAFASVGVERLRISNTGLISITNAVLQMSGSTVIDASRNLTAAQGNFTGTLQVGGVATDTSYDNAGYKLLFGGGTSDSQANYYIGTNLENVGGFYSKLDLRWHTGIRMGAQADYGGIRFYTTEDLTSKIMSIGEGSTAVRIYTSLQMGSSGTTVIDASRNITAGSITAGNFTPSGYISQGTGQSHYFRGGTDANWRIGSDITADTGGLVTGAALQMIVGGSGNTYGFQIFGHQTPTLPVFEVIPNTVVANSITNVRGKLYVNNTQVIDASRNVSSINLVKFRDHTASFYISPTNSNTLNAEHGSTSDTADMWINYRGYNDTFSNFRDFRIGNGKGAELLHVDGSAATFTFTGQVNIDYGSPKFVVGGTTVTDLSDANRPNITLKGGVYPHMTIDSRNAANNGTNTNHGPVFSFVQRLSTSGYRRFAIGTAGYNGDRLSFGYADNNTNPHYGMGTDSTGAMMYLTTGAQLIVNSSVNTPIVYDKDDTLYYVSPSSSSRLSYVNVSAGNETTGAANSSIVGLVMRGNYNSNTWAHKFHKMDHGGGVPLYLSATVGSGAWTARQRWGTYSGNTYESQIFGTLAVDTAVYTPMVYDKDNTAYYGDFASTSILNSLKVNSFAPASTQINYTGVDNGTFSFTNAGGGSANYTNRGGRVLTSNASGWHQDGEDPVISIVDSHTGTDINSAGIGLYMHNEQNTNSAYSPGILFGAKSTSNGYNSMYGAIYGRKTTNNTGVDTNWNSGELHFFSVGSGYVTSTPDLRIANHGDVHVKTAVYAPKFYDTDSTGYYLDPASTSNLNVLRLAGSLAVGGHTDSAPSGLNTSGVIAFGSLSADAIANYCIKTTLFNYGGNYNKLDFAFHTGIRMGAHPNYGGVRFFSDQSMGTEIASIGKSGNYVDAVNSMRAPIFYDNNNTAYYADFNTTGTSIKAAGITDSKAGFKSTANPWNTSDSAYFPNGITTANTTNWIYGHCYLGGAVSNGSGNDATAAGTIESTSWHKATSYIDRDNTAYYTDPAGTSNVNQINYGATNQYITGGTVFSSFQAVKIGGNWNEFECMGRVLDVSANNCHFMDGYGSTDHASHYLSIGGGNGGNGGLGYVMIGTDLNVTGNVTAYYSDARLKQNVETIPNALEILDNIRGVTFEWNKLAEGVWKKKQGDEDFGMIAQEVEAVFPMGVAIQGGADFNKAAGFADPDSPNYDPLHDPTKDDPEYKTVKYDKMVALAIQAIKELKAEVDELKERLNSK